MNGLGVTAGHCGLIRGLMNGTNLLTQPGRKLQDGRLLGSGPLLQGGEVSLAVGVAKLTCPPRASFDSNSWLA